MDSHSFRIIAAEIIRLLEGARLEKIHGPSPGLYAFTLFAGGKKRRLLFRFERQRPLLLFSDLRPENPPTPTATVMRLRKYCQGRRLGRGVADFAARQLAFSIAGADEKTELWLFFDLTAGAFALPALPPGFGEKAAWPDAGLVDSLCALDWQSREQKSGPWQNWAVLGPMLRETLAAIDPLEGRALLVDLEAGGSDLFLYADKSGAPALYSAWPLPDELLKRRGLLSKPLLPCEEPAPAFARWLTPVADLLPEFKALACATLVDEPKLFAALGAENHRREEAPKRKADKKTAKLLARLDQEEQRLNGLLALREDAILLQAELWRYAPEARLQTVPVTDGQGWTRLITLDPLFCVRENMRRMFKQSGRGARGLAMLKERRQAILAATGMDGAEREPLWAKTAEQAENETGESLPVRSDCAQKTPTPAENKISGLRELAVGENAGALKGVARFVSSDGFTLLRGKNARGNQALLKAGKGHDYWLHAEGGPSAHLVIRRSHPAEDVPERTLMEAAALVAEKSWQRQDAKATVMVAMLKHVHPVKGGSPGQVRVDKILQSLVLSI